MSLTESPNRVALPRLIYRFLKTGKAPRRPAFNADALMPRARLPAADNFGICQRGGQNGLTKAGILIADQKIVCRRKFKRARRCVKRADPRLQFFLMFRFPPTDRVGPSLEVRVMLRIGKMGTGRSSRP